MEVKGVESRKEGREVRKGGRKVRKEVKERKT